MNKLSSWVGILFLAATTSLLAQAIDPAIAPTAPPNAVPEGTTFLVRLQDKLDTADEDLISANGNAIPRGKKIKGHVSSVEHGLHARLLLSFDEIETNHGWVALIATVTGAPSERGVKAPDSEGEIERKGPSAKHTIEDAAVGAVLGTSVGAAAGGAKGAGTGGAAGVGAGAMASLLANRNLRLEKGTTLEVRLDRVGDPLALTPSTCRSTSRRDAACRVSAGCVVFVPQFSRFTSFDCNSGSSSRSNRGGV